MNDQTDSQLLCAYADRHSEAAFAELVRRHVDLVYSAAKRMVCDAHLAEDVTQGTFIALAKSAPQITGRPVLSGWLHRTAQNIAAQAVRTEVRRRIREQESAAMNDLIAPDATWEDIAPQLDAALGDLAEPDRDALLLRYFERKSAQEMAQILGISDEAAQKRVNRAVERLRDYFSKHRLTVGAGGLVALISANAVQSAPVGLASAISAAALLTSGAVSSSTLIAATKTIAMTTLQKAVVTVTVAALAGAGIYEARQAAQLRQQNQALQEQQTSLAEQVRLLQSEQNDATNRLEGLLADNSRLQKSPHEAELLKLRGEVARMRQELQSSPSARADLLRRKLAAMPDKKIPELQFLTEKDWYNAAWNADLDTDDGVRLALSKLRDEAVDTFLDLTRKALKKYLSANDDMLPDNLLALKSFYDVPATDEMLQRYAFMQTGKISSDHTASVVRKVVYADPDYDSNQEMSLAGGGGGSFNLIHNAIYDAAAAYTVANNGQIPSDPSQLAGYLKRPVDAAALQKYFEPIVADIASNSPPPAVSAWLTPAIKAYSADHAGQIPKSPADLQPYLSTPEQQAQLRRMVH